MRGHPAGARGPPLLCPGPGEGPDRPGSVRQTFEGEEEMNFIGAGFLFLHSLAFVTCRMLTPGRYSCQY